MLTDASFEEAVGARFTDDSYLRDMIKGTSNLKKASKTRFLGLGSSANPDNEAISGLKPALTQVSDGLETFQRKDTLISGISRISSAYRG